MRSDHLVDQELGPLFILIVGGDKHITPLIGLPRERGAQISSTFPPICEAFCHRFLETQAKCMARWNLFSTSDHDSINS
jgi:hypothetical protein